MDVPESSRQVGGAEQMRTLIMGFRATQLVHIAAKLGLADLLRSGPQEASTMANAVGAHPRALYRLLRALTSLGIFTLTSDGRFALTPLAETLRSDVAGSLRDLAVLYGDEWIWRAYGNASHSVMTGQPAFDHVYKRTFYEYVNEDPEAAASFHRGMTAMSAQETAAILNACNFAAASNVIDVGGGQGALLEAILTVYPHLHATLFDQPAVIQRARYRGHRSFCRSLPAGSGQFLRFGSAGRRRLSVEEHSAQLGR